MCSSCRNLFREIISKEDLTVFEHTASLRNMVKKGKSLTALFFLLSAFFLLPHELRAEFYKYVDENGTVHYVDSKSKIPREYLDDLTSYEEKYDHLSEEERSIMLENDRKRRKELRQRQLEEKRQREQIAKEKLLRQQKEEKLAEERRKQRIAKEKYLKSLQTKVTIEGGRVLVPCTLGYEKNEIEVLLVLDTGASEILLHEKAAEQLRIRRTKGGKGQVAGGDLISVRFAKLSFVKVGPYKKENLRTSITKHKGPPVGYDGLLGINFLRGLDYSIDFENQVIRWKPSTARSGNSMGTENEGLQ